MTAALRLDRWLSVSEAAQLAGVPRRTMLRRLWFLHSQVSDGVLRRIGKRKLQVSAQALERALRTDPELMDAELSGIVARIDDQDRKLLALRNAHRSLKARVKTLEDG